MKMLSSISRVQYAIIEALRLDAGPERLVIAYRGENSLRELIAAPRIIAAGFSSRNAAAKVLDAKVASAAA